MISTRERTILEEPIGEVKTSDVVRDPVQDLLRNSGDDDSLGF